MIDSLTHIIHIAWNVNFNLQLSSFTELDITGLCNLINIGLQSPRHKPPTLVFLSSVAVVQNYAPTELVPERSIEDIGIVPPNGYAESKFVAERLLDFASQCGLSSVIIRGGQLSGSTVNGYWNPKEFIPSLIKTSSVVGAIPEDLPA